MFSHDKLKLFNFDALVIQWTGFKYPLYEFLFLKNINFYCFCNFTWDKHRI